MSIECSHYTASSLRLEHDESLTPRDSRKSRQKMVKNTAHFSENRKITGLA